MATSMHALVALDGIDQMVQVQCFGGYSCRTIPDPRPEELCLWSCGPIIDFDIAYWYSTLSIYKVVIELQICLAHATRRPPSNMYMNLLLIPADDQHSCHYDQHRTSNSR